MDRPTLLPCYRTPHCNAHPHPCSAVLQQRCTRLCLTFQTLETFQTITPSLTNSRGQQLWRMLHGVTNTPASRCFLPEPAQELLQPATQLPFNFCACRAALTWALVFAESSKKCHRAGHDSPVTALGCTASLPPAAPSRLARSYI